MAATENICVNPLCDFSAFENKMLAICPVCGHRLVQSFDEPGYEDLGDAQEYTDELPE